MIQIVEDPIDQPRVIESVSGAVVTFDGCIRSQTRGKQVNYLYYEAFPKMAIKEIQKIRSNAMQRWPLEGLAIVHRIGRMEIGESSVFIAVASAHRREAFAACSFAIDTLKTTVPIWKKEYYQDGKVWIEGYSS